VTGILKGFDPLVNIVLDNTVEHLRDAENKLSDQTRDLGLVVARGTQVVQRLETKKKKKTPL
jgi:U6 snRNA-associated Sm-like protein LSm7